MILLYVIGEITGPRPHAIRQDVRRTDETCGVVEYICRDPRAPNENHAAAKVTHGHPLVLLGSIRDQRPQARTRPAAVGQLLKESSRPKPTHRPTSFTPRRATPRGDARSVAAFLGRILPSRRRFYRPRDARSGDRCGGSTRTGRSSGTCRPG